MRKREHAGMYLVRYYPTKPNDKLDIWNLEAMDIPKPVSKAYQNEVKYTLEEYEKIRDDKLKKDGELIFGNECEWLLVKSCENIGQAIWIFTNVKKNKGGRNNG